MTLTKKNAACGALKTSAAGSWVFKLLERQKCLKRKKIIPGICIFPLMTYSGELERNPVRNGGWKRKSFSFRQRPWH